MADPTYRELVELVASQALVIAVQAELIEKLTARVAELERRLGADSSNSSRPPSSDSPFTKKPAKARSWRKIIGRKPGKQHGDPAVSRSLADHPDQIVNIDPTASWPRIASTIRRCCSVAGRDGAAVVTDPRGGGSTSCALSALRHQRLPCAASAPRRRAARSDRRRHN